MPVVDIVDIEPLDLVYQRPAVVERLCSGDSDSDICGINFQIIVQISAAVLAEGFNVSPVARCQLLRDNFASAYATEPVSAEVAPCHGWDGEPSLHTRWGSSGRCSDVSPRSAVATIPTQKASLS